MTNLNRVMFYEPHYWKTPNYRYERLITEIRELEIKLIRCNNTLVDWYAAHDDHPIKNNY